jgi:hypothetical protein
MPFRAPSYNTYAKAGIIPIALSSRSIAAYHSWKVVGIDHLKPEISARSHKPYSVVSPLTFAMNCPFYTFPFDHIIFNYAKVIHRHPSHWIRQDLVTEMDNIVSRRFAIPRRISLVDPAPPTCISGPLSINRLWIHPTFFNTLFLKKQLSVVLYELKISVVAL